MFPRNVVGGNSLACLAALLLPGCGTTKMVEHSHDAKRDVLTNSVPGTLDTQLTVTSVKSGFPKMTYTVGGEVVLTPSDKCESVTIVLNQIDFNTGQPIGSPLFKVSQGNLRPGQQYVFFIPNQNFQSGSGPGWGYLRVGEAKVTISSGATAVSFNP